jgi:hypothetical protein
VAALEYSSVDTFGHKRTVNVIHGPRSEVSALLGTGSRGADHIVAMTLLKPASSMVAARFSPSSGRAASCAADSQADK